MGATNSSVTITDGSLDWSMGVDSIRATTIASENNPQGLPRNALSWLINGTTRGGGITQRYGWQPRGIIDKTGDIYQGGWMYEPGIGNPYLMLSIGGRLLRVDIFDDTSHTTDLTAATPVDINGAATLNPTTKPQFWFRQAEEFLIVQSGDPNVLPLFYDGATIRRSLGILGPTHVPTGDLPYNEIPSATAMDYFMGRLWYAQGRNYSAGDIVGSDASGTLAYNFRDSVLKVTESPLCFDGDGFTVPDNEGNIRAIVHSANINTQLGQGSLYIFTRKAVYSLSVPVTRTNWTDTDADNQPLQTVVQLTNGSVNDRSIVSVNGDLFYQSFEPAVRSLITAVRTFNQWGNIDISSNEFRILQGADRSLLWSASGIYFDGRLLETALPSQHARGPIYKGIMSMDFVPLSTLQKTAQPVWEGTHSGLDILQLFTGDFGGRPRAFAVVVSREDGSIQVWELTDADKFENGEGRVTWQMEFPAFTWGNEFQLKKLVSAELWVDKVGCPVDMYMDYRPDGDTCWREWYKWQICTPRDSCEGGGPCYPVENYGPTYRATITLPLPPVYCEQAMTRPSNIGYQFQLRLTIKGYCRLRGLMVHAAPVERKLYDHKVC